MTPFPLTKVLYNPGKPLTPASRFIVCAACLIVEAKWSTVISAGNGIILHVLNWTLVWRATLKQKHDCVPEHVM